MRLTILSVFVFISALFLILPIVAAEIIISESESIYNFGDEIKLTTTAVSAGVTDDFLRAVLVCGDSNKEVYNSIQSLEAGSESVVPLKIPLRKSIIGTMSGECHVYSVFMGDVARTRSFKITDLISLTLSLDKKDINPGESINLRGDAIKGNGQALSGFANIAIEKTGFNVTKVVSDGKFLSNLTLEKDASSGTYLIVVEVYEKDDSGVIINKGISTAAINVKQVPKALDFVVDDQEIKPGDNFKFKLILLDQSSAEIVDEELSFKIYDVFGDSVYEKLIKTGQEFEYPIKKSADFGYWKIIAISNSIKSERLFYVEENQEADFNLVNGTLIITNIGNVPYNKMLEVSIGNKTTIVEVSLDLARSKKLALEAPNGEYSININDGSKSFSKEGVILTGKTVSVDELGNSIIKNFSLLWIFLILLLSLLVFLLVKRRGKASFFARMPLFSKLRKSTKKHKVSALDLSKTHSGGDAKHSLVIKGAKQRAGIILIDVRNMNSLTNEAKKILKDTLDSLKIKGATHHSGNAIMLILAPVITKTFKNEIEATRLAMRIDKILKDNNRKFKEKLDYGIAVHTGDIVANTDDGKFNFTGLGNTISQAKKIAAISKGEVLLTKDLHEKTLSDIKVIRKQGDVEAYAIKELNDKQEHSKFIKDFMRRLDDGKK